MNTELKKYWQSGLATLPVGDNKAPFGISTWNGGIPDIEKYDKAFGLGIICGEKSGGIECLDFDNHFGDAKNTLSEFIGEINELYKKYNFPIESTMGGGYHFIYRCKTIQGNLKLASKPQWNERMNKFIPDAIIETRGEGGYFVAAPTPGYQVVRNSLYEIPEILPEDRDIIIQTAKSFNKWYDKRETEHEQSDKPGDLFNRDPDAVDELKSELQSVGWDEVKAGMWRRPEKDKGISATLGKVADNVFYVFSSSAYPFEPNKGYTPFAAIGLLKYNSDFKTFAKDLAERYKIDRPEQKQHGKIKEEVRDTKKLDAVLIKSHIDLSVPVAKPPVCFKIKDFEYGEIRVKRLLTLSNFSAIIGKSKSKKSFLASIFLAAAIRNESIDNKIVADMPLNKRGVLLFDTEQAIYDAFICADRAVKTSGLKKAEHFGAFDLREYSSMERCDIIGYALEKLKDKIGYVVIDGIADLATAINDEMEATRVTSLLMKWTAEHNIHISVIIHQNKNDNWATGHLGSAILKKAEAIISVTKDSGNAYKSNVSCEMIRGVSDFNDFTIEINEDGLPEIKEMKEISSQYTENDLIF